MNPHFGHLMWRTNSLEKTLMLWKIEDRWRRGWQRMRWLDGTTNSMDMSLSRLQSWWWTGKPGVLHAVHGITKSQTRLSNRSELNWTELNPHELVEAWKLITLTSVTFPITSPPTNQKIVWTDYIPYDPHSHFVFKNPPLKAIRKFRSFEH